MYMYLFGGPAGSLHGLGSVRTAGRVLRSRHEQEQQQEGGEAEADVDEQPFDPLKPLDPNDRGRLPIRPLQVRCGAHPQGAVPRVFRRATSVAAGVDAGTELRTPSKLMS